MSVVSLKCAQVQKDVILHAVFVYVRYAVSDRDLEEILTERGVHVDHATPNRWVVKYAPALAEIARKRKAPAGASWRFDGT